MNKITLTELVQQHCKATQQWAVVLYPDATPDFEELKKAVPFLDLYDDAQAITDGIMVVLCSSDNECWEVFNQISGTDMLENDYSGPCKVYALTCGPDGEILTENT